MAARTVLLFVGVFCSSCLEQCAKGQVAQGVSQLTIRNVGAIVELINEDTKCGFASEAVNASPVVQGSPGKEGTVTWQTTDCQIELTKELPRISESCTDTLSQVLGRVSITASRTVGGLITGDQDRPVIPGGPDAVTIRIEKAVLQDFSVQRSDSDSMLTIKSGTLSAVARPRMAVDADTGICSIATPNVAFSEVIYHDALVLVQSDGRDFEVPIARSELSAFSGNHPDAENSITGSIHVWDVAQSIPSEDEPLDPDYEPERHLLSYNCKAELAQPVRYDCNDVIRPLLAQGAARLLIRTLGTTGDRLDKDTACGFGSEAVLDAVTLEGEVGSVGTAVLQVDRCTLDFGAGTVVATNCLGEETKIRGRVVVSGTKRLSGRLTGDRETPVVPMTDGPAEVDIVIHELNDYEVMEGGTGLLIRSGSMQGRIRPRVAADTAQQGACGFESDIARFEGVTIDQAQARLRSDSGRFDIVIDDASLDALNGTWGSDSNLLDGTITIFDELFSLPARPEDDGLDPEFDQATFDAGWQCGSVALPVRHDCHFVDPIAQGASQLSVQLVGKLVELLDANTSCGFSSPEVLESAAVEGTLGDRGGAATWTVGTPCYIHFAGKTEIARDCNGKATYAEGAVWLTGTKTVEGIVSGHPVDVVVPTSRDPARISISGHFEDFALWSDPETNKLTIHEGSISSTVRPRVALDRRSGACSIVTPVAEISDLKHRDTLVTLESDGKLFTVRLDDSALAAVNGSKDGVTNRLTGSIALDGETIAIPTEGEPILDPEFDQTLFDASYACEPNLELPNTEAQCDMTETLGEGVARLVVMSVGTISGQVNGNDDCGFEALDVKTHPTNVVGEPGEMGEMAWAISGCDLSSASETDCLGIEKHMSGSARVAAERMVVGLREEIRILFVITFDSIVPTEPTAVQIALQDVQLNNFSAYELAPQSTVPDRSITIRSGTLSAVVQPITGENAEARGTFDIATPVAQMSDIRLQNADVSITSEGKTFNVRVTDSAIDAFNGSFDGLALTNQISGTITIGDQQVVLPSEDGLDPDFEQSNFDARYACTPGLVATIPPAP